MASYGCGYRAWRSAGRRCRPTGQLATETRFGCHTMLVPILRWSQSHEAAVLRLANGYASGLMSNQLKILNVIFF